MNLDTGNESKVHHFQIGPKMIQNLIKVMKKRLGRVKLCSGYSFILWYLFILKFDCLGRNLRKSSVTFSHCSNIRTVTFFIVTKRAKECFRENAVGAQ